MSPATSETRTTQLEAQVAESIGNQSPILAKTLSYFPIWAERFVEMQDFANLVAQDGQKELRFSYRLPGKGSQEDTLDPFPGLKQVLNSIAVVSWIRGENEQGCNGWEAEKIKEVLETHIHQLQTGDIEDWEIRKKALDILKITPVEVDLMRHFLELNQQADEIQPEKDDFKPETDELYKSASQLRDQAYALIQANWPEK